MEENERMNDSSADAEVSSENQIRDKASRKPIYIASAIALLVLLIGGLWLLYKRQFVSTDDAHIEGNITFVTSKINASVKKVHVKENQFVKKGDLLVELDDQEQQVKLQQADAELQAALAKNKKASAQADYTRNIGSSTIDQATASLNTANRTIEQSRADTSLQSDLQRKARSAVETARANLAQAESEIPAASAMIAQAKTNVTAAKSNYEAMRLEHERDAELFGSGYVPKSKFEESQNQMVAARSRYESAEKEVEIAQARLISVRKQVDVERSRLNQAIADFGAAGSEVRKAKVEVDLSHSRARESKGKLDEARSASDKVAVENGSIAESVAEIDRARADVAQAELELSYTKIYAPQDGYIAKKAVVDGQIVQPDVALMSVTLPGIWVVGNFKETDIKRIAIGAQVDIRVDAYPSVKFRGKVESFQPGTGSRFSVLPSDNASGNFIKVVQKVPVRIAFENLPKESKYVLVPGMSVEPHVKAK
ncbi:MAG: efflux RND transporter periplasmic adaptor subunit [Pyrinomonadaceae bacterium]